MGKEGKLQSRTMKGGGEEPGEAPRATPSPGSASGGRMHARPGRAGGITPDTASGAEAARPGGAGGA